MPGAGESWAATGWAAMAQLCAARWYHSSAVTQTASPSSPVQLCAVRASLGFRSHVSDPLFQLPWHRHQAAARLLAVLLQWQSEGLRARSQRQSRRLWKKKGHTMGRECWARYRGLPGHWGFWTAAGMRRLETGPEMPLGYQLFLRNLEGRTA